MQLLIAVVAGSGQVASAAVAGGADLLLVLSAGRYRALGVGSLASFLAAGNANQETRALLVEQVLPRAGRVPVIAGVLACDPTIDLDRHLAGLRALGVYAVANWPAAGFVDGVFGEALAEEEGFSPAAERALFARARTHGLAGCAFALRPEDAAAFAADGVETVVLNLGLTRAVEDARSQRDQLARAVQRLGVMVRAVRATGTSSRCLAFGGPVTTADDLAALLRVEGLDGFAGGSVFERLPVGLAVEATVRRFRAAALRADDDAGASPLIGASRALREVEALIARAAPHDVPVLISGETGTGKELVANELHRRSPRAAQPLVTCNCGAIPDSLLESELFGHERGAFTGAERRRPGKFELAHRGTLFLDEIADLSAHGQVALLRAIQQREIVRLGGDQPIPVNVRLVAASNCPLEPLLAAGRFRADLYYRLNALSIVLPPLRERPEDLPRLVDHLLARLAVRLGRRLVGISAVFADKLAQYAWPGNVRELEHVIMRAALLEDGAVLDGRWFAPQPHAGVAPPAARGERARRALADAAGNKSRAAAALGISRKTLYQWLAGC